MVDSESDRKSKSSNVNQSTINSAQTTGIPAVDKQIDTLHFNHNPPLNSQIPGQFNHYEQHYRQIPEDKIDSNAQSEQSQLAAVYKSTTPRFSFDDETDAKKYAVFKANGNGSCSSDNSEKFPNITSITPIANANVAKADFEQAIELAGYGKFHYILLAICGLVSTSEEMDVISMSFILPSAQCDLDLNTQTKGWLNSIIFIGMMVGAYVWGSIADTLGRRKVLIVISFMNAVCIVASSFCQSYIVFMIFRFLNGVA